VLGPWARAQTVTIISARGSPLVVTTRTLLQAPSENEQSTINCFEYL
jgi:hypothetical protein